MEEQKASDEPRTYYIVDIPTVGVNAYRTKAGAMKAGVWSEHEIIEVKEVRDV